MIRLLLLTLAVSAARPREDSRTVWDDEEDARETALEEAGLMDGDTGAESDAGPAGQATPLEE